MTGDWDPDKDNVQDEFMKEALELMREQNKRTKSNLKGIPLNLPKGFAESSIKFPTMDEQANKCKKIWEKIKSIAPDAPERVQAIMFDMLRFAQNEDDSE